MKVSVEDRSSTEKKVDVVIPAETVRLEREGIVRNIMRNAKVDGFRKGKVPEAEVMRLFDGEIKQELISNLISNSFDEALKEVSATPVSRPAITPGVLGDGENEFSYSAVFDVLPQFDLPQYKGLVLKQSPISVSKGDVDAAIKQIVENAATVEPCADARPCKAGDVVEVDYCGTIDGNTIEGLEKKEVKFLLGAGHLIEDFEKNIRGMSGGDEKEFEVFYPEDFQIPEAAGKSVKFILKVNKVFDRTVPEMNDEFAKKMGSESVVDLRVNIEKDMMARLEALRNNSLDEQICSKLGESADFEIPARMVADEKGRIEEEIKKRGGKELKIDEKMSANLLERARDNVKISLLISRIAEAECIEATDADLRERFSSVAAQTGASPEQVREYYEKNRLLNGLNSQVISDKVLGFIRGEAQIQTEQQPSKSD